MLISNTLTASSSDVRPGITDCWADPIVTLHRCCAHVTATEKKGPAVASPAVALSNRRLGNADVDGTLSTQNTHAQGLTGHKQCGLV